MGRNLSWALKKSCSFGRKRRGVEPGGRAEDVDKDKGRRYQGLKTSKGLSFTGLAKGSLAIW